LFGSRPIQLHGEGGFMTYPPGQASHQEAIEPLRFPVSSQI